MLGATHTFLAYRTIKEKDLFLKITEPRDRSYVLLQKFNFHHFSSCIFRIGCLQWLLYFIF